MYQVMSVLQVQSDSPVSGSKAAILPAYETTNSCRPDGAVTRIGVFHESLMPPARHFSLPVLRSRATSDRLSTDALMNTNSPPRTGDAAVPQPFVLSPTSVCQSCLP